MSIGSAERPLKAYAFDPSRGRHLGNEMRVVVKNERLRPGPIGRKIAVIDYDVKNRTYYRAVDLDDPEILMRGGLDPSESDPRFHQQMVYAVTMNTIEHFEAALGRQIHWRRSYRTGSTSRPVRGDDIWVLRIFPHAMPDANAFYCPSARGILYGYFRASRDAPGRNLPGQTVFTCLSHDIIVHETTHAIIDGIRAHFTEPTNPDVPAFHEAVADLAALFRHFSHKEVLLDTIQRTGGRLFDFEIAPDAGVARSSSPVIAAQIAPRNPLIDLARQFGDALGLNAGLRSALGTAPAPADIRTRWEPHQRGSILVAAVFDAFFAVYLQRTGPYFQVYRAGGGGHDDDIPAPLAELLAREAGRTADDFFRVCVRALEYCPPVDITFGDYLRALMTVHRDLDPSDRDGIRAALMESFRLRGIVARDAAFFSEDALCWPRLSASDLPTIPDLKFGDSYGQTKEQRDANGKILRAYARRNAAALGFDPSPELPISVPSFHSIFRIAPDGMLRTDMVIELVQTRRVPFDAKAHSLGDFPLRGAATLIVARPSNVQPAEVRYVIGKKLHGPEGAERARRQRDFYQASGFVDGRPGDDSRFRIDFAMIHGRT